MKYNHVNALFLMFVFCTSCKGQNKTEQPRSNIKPENKEVITSHPPNSITRTINSETKDVITSHGPNSITRNIIHDRKGNIWIASWEGIFRYDGKSFTNITSKVSSARFFSVLEDRKGNLWFGSIGSGVYYYDGKSFRNFTTKDGLANDGVTCIYEDKAGTIWFGTARGASRYDGKSFRNYKMNVGFQALPDNNDNDVNSIIEDKTGKFWFGTRGNAYVYDGKTFTKFTNKDGNPFKNVRSIIEDKKGNIWLGGNDGLWRYDGSIFTNFTQKFVGYIYEDKKGNIWTSSVSAYDQSWALSRYDEKSLSNNKATVTSTFQENMPLFNNKATVTEIKSKEGMIFGVLEAYDGNIWYGTGKGVYRYDGNTITDSEGKVVQEYFFLH